MYLSTQVCFFHSPWQTHHRVPFNTFNKLSSDTPGQQLIELTDSNGRLEQSNKSGEITRKRSHFTRFYPWAQEHFKIIIPETQKGELLSDQRGEFISATAAILLRFLLRNDLFC